MKTISSILSSHKKKLINLGFSEADASIDLSVLLAHVLNIKNVQNMVLCLNKKLSDKECKDFEELFNRRLHHEPIAYIVGYKDFWKRRYYVNNNVLIPRPETECIIEAALKIFDKNSKISILDLGTGSGCLALSLLDEFENSSCTAVDISEDALKVATINAKHFQLDQRISFIYSNWFENVTGVYDLIVSNPPYISSYEWQRLSPSMKDYEPKVALTDNLDGLNHYEDIIKKSRRYLSTNGKMIFEIGYNQSEDIRHLSERGDYKVRFYQDLQRIKRVAILEKL